MTQILSSSPSSHHLSRIVKPQVLAVFADIAMAIEADFQRYAPLVLHMLQQAGEVTITTTDEEIIEYINSLREAILEAYAGIIQVTLFSLSLDTF